MCSHEMYWKVIGLKDKKEMKEITDFNEIEINTVKEIEKTQLV
ncbi:MAG: hypothetical protein ACTSRI_15430 [Promethearchaeota archaeon]